MRKKFLIDYTKGVISDFDTGEIIATREMFTIERISLRFGGLKIVTGYEKYCFTEHKYDCDEIDVKTALRFLYGKDIGIF